MATTDLRTDEELAALTAQGDREAFTLLYQRYFDSIYDYASRLARDPDVGADLAQGTFERALKALVNQRPPGKFRPWLFQIAYNSAMDYWRSARRTTLYPESGDGEDYSPYEQVDTDRLSDPELVVRDQEIVSFVRQAEASLSPRERTALDLRYRQELDAEEIAVVMGVRQGGVHKLLARARESFEGAFVSLLLMQRGRPDCPQLDRLAQPEATQPMTSVLRKRIQRHLTQCSVCQNNRARFASPVELFGALAPIAAPLAIKEGLLGILLGQQQALANTGGGLAQQGPTSTGAETGGHSVSVSTGKSLLGALTSKMVSMVVIGAVAAAVAGGAMWWLGEQSVLDLVNTGGGDRGGQSGDSNLKSADAQVCYNQGVRLQVQGKLEDAIAKYDECLHLDSELTLAYNNRGQAYNDLGQHQRAIGDYDEAIRLDSQFALAYNNRGLAYYRLGQATQAIAQYDEAIRLDPELAVAHYNRGLANLDQDQYQQAVEDYSEAIRLRSRLAPAYADRAVAYTLLGQDAAAQQDADRAIELGYDAERLRNTIEGAKGRR